MLITIDIGNTNIKFGIFINSKLVKSFRMASVINKTSDEYFITIQEIFRTYGLDKEKIEGIIISSVNPAINYTFEHICLEHLSIEPIFVTASLNCGFELKNKSPFEIGADILANCCGAYKFYKNPKLIVLDCGTATTFNCLIDGVFVGNVISIGLRVASDSLSNSAAKLPQVELYSRNDILGTTTADSMRSGLIFGFVGSTEYIIKKIKDQVGDCKVVATGGMSEIVANNSKCIDFIDRELTLKGLKQIYDLNKVNA